MIRTRLTAERLEERLTPALGDLLQTLSYPSANLGDNFGNAVAVDGNLAVVGVAADDPGGVTNAGSAYVFNVTTGALVATLKNPAPAEFDFFGNSVAISGTAVVVGADADDTGGMGDVGTAYVFDISTGPTPAPLATLNNPTPAANEYFGTSVAISGTRVVVGAADAPGGVIFAGSAYVFDVLFGPNPSPFATLKNPAPAEFDQFGGSVAISGTRVVVGAPGDDPGGVDSAGSAYVFDVFSGPTPAPIATLNNPAPAKDDNFGLSVALSRTLLAVVGAPGDDPGGVGNAGSAYVFNVFAGPAPAPIATLNNPSPAMDDFFGAVAISETRIVVGASGDNPDVTNAGSAYVFDVFSGPTPAPIATLNNPTRGRRPFRCLGGDQRHAGGRRGGLGRPRRGDRCRVRLRVRPEPAAGGQWGERGGGGVRRGRRAVRLVPCGDPDPVRGLHRAGPRGHRGRERGRARGHDRRHRAGRADPRGCDLRGGQQLGVVAPFDPFGGDFLGGGFVAARDIDLDGRAEFVVTPDQGGGPRVSVFSLTGGAAAVRANFLGIDDAAFRGGARAALGDVNADGVPDLVVCAGFLGGPRTALFDGTTLFGTPARLIGDFFAFPGSDAVTLRNGVFVAAGDVDGDGAADLIFGGGPGGAPRVFVLSGARIAAGDVAGAQASPVANFFVANNSVDRGGVRLAAKDADGDNKADVVAGSGEGSPSKVRVYLGTNFTGGGEPSAFQDIDPFAATLPGGVFVG